MSSISSVGGGNGLFGFLQSLSATSQSQAATATTATANTAATANTPATTVTDPSQSVPGGHHHHHHHGQGGEAQAANSQLFSQIQQAVTGALQSATQNGTNPNQAIEDAISQVFQNNNAAQQTSDSSAQANTPASTTDAQNTTGTPSSTGSSALQAFFQTLQSAGIDPQQFHQDFFTAVQNAQNGNTNPGTAFQSFPPGSIVDTLG